LVATVADAVAACHAYPGDPIIHRDLTLSNIRLQPCAAGETGACEVGGQFYVPKLIDFGLARVSAGPPGARSVTLERAGTAPFMAPELFLPDGRPPTEAIDIYALGVILHRILTGAFPIEPPEEQNTVRGLPAPVSKDRRLDAADDRLAANLDRVCYHCLRKAAAKRPRADQLAEDLRGVAAGHDPHHAPEVTDAMREEDEEEFQPNLRDARKEAREQARNLKVQQQQIEIQEQQIEIQEQQIKIRGLQRIGLGALALVIAVAALVAYWFVSGARDQAQLARDQAQLDRARLLLDAGMSEVRAGDPGFGAILIAQSLKQAPPDARGYHTVARRAAAAAWASVHPLVAIIPGDGLVRAAPVWMPRGNEHGPSSSDALVLLPDNKGRIRHLSLRTGGQAITATTRVPTTGGPLDRMLVSLTAAAISPDGKRFAVASSANRVSMFDMNGDHPSWQADVPDPRGLAFTPDGRSLWVAGRGNQSTSLTCYDPATGNLLRSLKSDRLNAVAVSSDGRWLAAGGGGEGKISVWDISAGTSDRAVYTTAASGAVFCLTFSPTDHKILVSGDAGNEARFWDVDAKQEAGPPIRHNAQVRVVAFSPDGQHLLTGAEDNTAQVWHANSRTPVGHRLWHAAEVRAGAFSRDRLVTVDFRGETRVWRFNPDGGDIVFRHPAPLRDAAFDASGNRIVTGCTDAPGSPGAARVWQASGQLDRVLPQGAETVAVRFHPSRPIVATGDNRGSVYVWDLTKEGEAPPPLRNPGGMIRGLAFGGPGGRYLAYVGQHNKDRPNDPAGPFVYDLDRKQQPVPLNHQADSFGWNVAFTPDQRGLVSDGGKEAAAWRFDETAQAWRPHRKGLYARPDRSGTPPDVMGSVISPAGDHVLVWDEDSHVAVIGLETGHSRTLLPPDRSDRVAHSAKVSGAVFSPDGTVAVTAAADGQAILWGLSDPPRVLATIQHGSPVLSVAMHPAGTMLATGTQDGVVRLWSMPGAEWHGHFRAHRGPVVRVAFSPAGTAILAASHDRTARLFRTPDSDPDAGVNVDEIISRIEIDTGVSVVITPRDADAAFGPPRVLTRNEWEERRRRVGRMVD
jgi:WD40 repeat protein